MLVILAMGDWAGVAMAQTAGFDAGRRNAELTRTLSQIRAQRVAIRKHSASGDRVSSALQATYEHAARRWRELSEQALELTATVSDLEDSLSAVAPHRPGNGPRLRRIRHELARAEAELASVEDMAAAYDLLKAESLTAMTDGPMSDSDVAEIDRLLGLDQLDIEFASGPSPDMLPERTDQIR